MKLRVITVGGTIDKVYYDELSTYEVGEPQVLELFREANVDFEYEVESVLQKDSLNMTDEDRQVVRDRVLAAPESFIVITHGTDTMTATAAALKGIEGKTIVLTGSMQPARFRNSDALFNVGTAVAAAQLAQPGVYIAMNGRVFDAGSVRKNRERGVFEPLG